METASTLRSSSARRMSAPVGADVRAAAAVEPGDGDADRLVGAAHLAGGFGAGDGDGRHGGDRALHELSSGDFAHGCSPFKGENSGQAGKVVIPGAVFVRKDIPAPVTDIEKPSLARPANTGACIMR